MEHFLFSKQSVKAGLLSALVCPGAGNIALKSYVRGVIYVGLSLLCLALFLNASFPILSGLISELSQSGNIVSVRELMDSIKNQLFRDRDVIKIAIGSLVLWLIALFDAIFVGHYQDTKLHELQTRAASAKQA